MGGGGTTGYGVRSAALIARLLAARALRVGITDFCSGFVEQIAAGARPTFLRHDILAVGSSGRCYF